MTHAQKPESGDPSPGDIQFSRRLLLFCATISIGWYIWHQIQDAAEWGRREQETALIQSHYPKLTNQFASLNTCVGSWSMFKPVRPRWLTCDLAQVRKATHAGLGSEYARFMLERDRQLEANGIRLYPKQALGGGGD